MQLFVRDKEFYKKAAAIALPVAMQSMITIGVNMMDTIMLGSFGEVQLSASSLANQFYNIFQILCMGMGFGAAVMTSQYWGRQDIKQLKKVVTLMLRICLCIATLFTLMTIFMPDKVMGLYTNDINIIQSGMLYYRFLSLTFIFQGLALTTTIVLRSVGIVRISLMSSICAFFINIFFNYIFIFGKFGAPRLEIAGAAIGTLIARAFEACFIFGYFIWIDKKIGYRIKDFFIKCCDIIKEFFHFSVPVIVSDLLLALGNNAVAMVMGRIGADFVSANAITMVIVQISTVFIQGISNAGSIMTGHTLGRGEKEKAYQEGVTFLSLSLIIGACAGLFIFVTSNYVIDFYNITDHTKGIAKELMNAIALIVFFQASNSVMTKGVLRGGGDTKFLMIADILFLWVASIPLGYLAGLVFHWSAFWIYFCLKIDQVIKAFWCIGRLKSKKWIKIVE